MAPENFGKYKVTALLGTGGMAEVYAGVQPDLGRKVAIKVILPQFATDANFEARFRREARLVASLRHPHIVQIYDFDVVDGRHFMVMEYLEGGTLKDHLRELRQKKARMPLPQTAGLLDAMASALDYAHARGAIHRDIKPANILFTAAREPVLSDFGIAKLLEDAVQLTATGGVMGSPHYIPPEQASGGEVNAASDQYSLGVVLYELVTGRVPFQGNSAVAVMTQHVNSAPPPPRSVNGELPAAVEAVLLKVLAKRPGDRFGSVLELAQAFRAAVEGRSVSAAPGAVDAAYEETVVTGAEPERSGPARAGGTGAAEVAAPRSPSAAPSDDAATVVDPGAKDLPAPVERTQDDRSHYPPAPRDPALPVTAGKREDIQIPSTGRPSMPKPTTQSVNIGEIKAGVVNQGGEQTFGGDLTFNLDFGESKPAPRQPEPPSGGAAVARGGDLDLASVLDALRRAYAPTPRVERVIDLVTQFYTQLEALPAERAPERTRVVQRVRALLTEMTQAQPDADMVEIMATSLERAVQPLSEDDPDLPTMATRITGLAEVLVQPE